MKNLLLLSIIVHFLMPFHEHEYRNVKSYYLNDQGTVYVLRLTNDKEVRLPSAFTVIEEK